MPESVKPRSEINRDTLHSIQGRNALTELLRKRGYRSRKEIQAEKWALQALRADFAGLGEIFDPIDRAHKCLDVLL